MVKLVHSTSSSVTLEWCFDENDPTHPAFITGYLVTVQETGTDVLSRHHDASECREELWPFFISLVLKTQNIVVRNKTLLH